MGRHSKREENSSELDQTISQLSQLSDEALMKARLRELCVPVEATEVQSCVNRLYDELASRGLSLKPKVYFGDEWFSPEGIPAISVPFYLGHPRLKTLEEKIMLEVEGGTPDACMKILRHEAGHCFDHAYKVSKRKTWRELFGSPERDYTPETYRPRPYSRSYVKHLDNWYAQAHPDEDFAETFAVWLTPDVNWKQAYSKWPVALKKLEFIDKLAKEFSQKEPVVSVPRRLPYAAEFSAMTLEKYYNRRRREHAEDYPDFYDEDLIRIFKQSTGDDISAAVFMRKYKKEIVDTVSFWTGERKFTVSSLVKKLVERCEKLGLKVSGGERRTILEVASYLTTLVMHYLFTGKFKRSV